MEYAWLIVAGLIILLLVLVYKSQDLLFIFIMFKKYLPIILVFGFIILVVFSIAHINKNYDTDYSSVDGIAKTAKIYGVWVKDFGVKVARVTGQAINQDWFSNSSVDDLNERDDRTNRRPTRR